MSSVLIHTDGRVIAAIDASVYARSVAELASWAAQRISAPLELLRTIERSATPANSDLSGNLSLGSREELLNKLAELDEQRGKLSQEHGRLLLQDTQSYLQSTYGLTAQSRLRHGALVDALLELEPDTRLFVLGKRGEHADFAKGHLGSNLERVMRAVHRPVLVASRNFRRIKRFLIAFDGSPTTRKCVEMVCASPLFVGLECELLLVGESGAHSRQQVDWALERLSAAGYQAQTQIVAGSPEAIITTHLSEREIDLLVMGAYGHSKIRSMIVGSTTTGVLRNSHTPVLLLR